MRSYPRLVALFTVLVFGCGEASAQTDSTEEPPPMSPPSASAAVTPGPGVFPSSAVESSVVKIYAKLSYPELYKPWAKQSPSEVVGSGVVIEGNRILTNAHVVSYAHEIQVQAGTLVSAKVVAIAPGIDLAVLKLETESFFQSHPPLARAKKIPELKDAVLTYGFPTGGSTLSVTKGIVSRIEFASYSNSTSGLRIQIDAAINPGNSGGPAVVDDKMVGLAFSRLRDSQNIGYIIPNEEIELFLQDIADGHYDGKPAMYDYLQNMDSAIRRAMKLNDSVKGIIVHKPASSEPNYPLKEWDVITKIGDISIDEQGMTPFGFNQRISFRYWIQKLAKDGKVRLSVCRLGKPLVIDLPVPAKRPALVYDLGGAYPSYFIYGPLVFSEATTGFLNGYAKMDTAGKSPTAIALLKHSDDLPSCEGERLVVVSSPFFPHKLSSGYRNPSGKVVKKINDVTVKNLAHLVGLLRNCSDDYVRIEFELPWMETFVFPRAEMIKATEDVLTENGIRNQGSPDVLDVWTGKKGF